MNKIQRLALYEELIDYCTGIDINTKPEVGFKLFMDTKRRFRADIFMPDKGIIIEINGGQFVNGRHNRGGKGYETDLHKINLAQFHGYKVFQFTYEMLSRQEYKEFI